MTQSRHRLYRDNHHPSITGGPRDADSGGPPLATRLGEVGSGRLAIKPSVSTTRMSLSSERTTKHP